MSGVWLGSCRRCCRVLGSGGCAGGDQRAGAEQGAADDRAGGEDAGGPPECGVVAVGQREPGQGLAADDLGCGQVGGEVGGDGGGENRIEQRGTNGGPELLADGDGGGGDAGVLRGYAEGPGVD